MQVSAVNQRTVFFQIYVETLDSWDKLVMEDAMN